MIDVAGCALFFFQRTLNLVVSFERFIGGEGWSLLGKDIVMSDKMCLSNDVDIQAGLYSRLVTKNEHRKNSHACRRTDLGPENLLSNISAYYILR
jgi:hypothetical protein